MDTLSGETTLPNFWKSACSKKKDQIDLFFDIYI